MNITTSIWGAPETWYEQTFYNKAVGKVATFGNSGHTLADAITGGNLEFNKKITDMSISWCAHGDESNYNHIIAFDDNNKATDYVHTDIPSNFMFYCIKEGGTSTYPQVYNINKNSAIKTVYLWEGFEGAETFSTQNANKYIQPFTDFYLKQCVWRIRVNCARHLTVLQHLLTMLIIKQTAKQLTLIYYTFLLHRILVTLEVVRKLIQIWTVDSVYSVHSSRITKCTVVFIRILVYHQKIEVTT